MKKIILASLTFLFVMVSSFEVNAQCSDTSLEWDTNATWNQDDQSNTYTVPNGNGGNTTVTVDLIDPNNRNDDSDQYDVGTHPFDPAGGCLPYPGATGPTEADTTPGDGSITDPWDSDCNHAYTMSNGAFGVNYLTYTLNTFEHTDSTALVFTFSDPVVLNNFIISDIDAVGFYYATQIGEPEFETPGNSYQDEIYVRANTVCGDSTALVITPGSKLIVDSLDSYHVYSVYDLGGTDDMPPTDPDHTLTISSTAAITELTIMYSNGYDDAVAEQTYPQFYTWWTDANGTTNGVSDDQAVRVDGMDFCVCPELATTFTGAEADVCTEEPYTLTAATTGGTGPYTYTWSDETGTQVGTGESFTVTPTTAGTTTYTVEIVDDVCCPGTATIAVNVIECCAPVICLPVTVTKNEE